MQNFLYKIQEFMRGRYGFDELNKTLLVLSIVLNIITRFVYNFPAHIIIQVIALSLFVLCVFRMLSRNCYQREKENSVFKPFYEKVRDFFKITYKKFRDGRTHRYYKCPNCKAQLRVKNVKGAHTIRCPKCGYQFQKKIR